MMLRNSLWVVDEECPESVEDEGSYGETNMAGLVSGLNLLRSFPRRCSLLGVLKATCVAASLVILLCVLVHVKRAAFPAAAGDASMEFRWPEGLPRNVYMTYLAQAKDLHMVYTLAESLRSVGSRWPLAVLLAPGALDEEQRRLLRRRGMIVHSAPAPGAGAGAGEVAEVGASEDVLAAAVRRNPQTRMNLLHLWKMKEYRRILFVDWDQLLLKNMDELFSVAARGAGAVQAGTGCKGSAGGARASVSSNLLLVKPDERALADMLGMLRAGWTGSAFSLVEAYYRGVGRLDVLGQSYSAAVDQCRCSSSGARADAGPRLGGGGAASLFDVYSVHFGGDATALLSAAGPWSFPSDCSGFFYKRWLNTYAAWKLRAGQELPRHHNFDSF